MRRTQLTAQTQDGQFLSTHPSRSATAFMIVLESGSNGFYPRTPRGVRPLHSQYLHSFSLFLSTHPSRSATFSVCYKFPILIRFYPRTPRGVRHRLSIQYPYCIQFLSTHPSRSATKPITFAVKLCAFLSTHPSRSATLIALYKSKGMLSFYPRTPRGVRLSANA